MLVCLYAAIEYSCTVQLWMVFEGNVLVHLVQEGMEMHLQQQQKSRR